MVLWKRKRPCSTIRMPKSSVLGLVFSAMPGPLCANCQSCCP
jgi:hypothetical protein